MAQAIFSPGATIVCNLAARYLGEYLSRFQPSEVASWAVAGRDMTADLPERFTIPKGIRGRITAAALRGLGQRTPDGRCPAWDLILQTMHDAAATALANAQQGGYAARPEYAADIEALRRVRACAALLARPEVRPWYYRQMDALQKRLLAVGVPGGASVGAEESGEAGQA